MATKVQKNILSRLYKAQRSLLNKSGHKLTLEIITSSTVSYGLPYIATYIHEWDKGNHKQCKSAFFWASTTQEQAEEELAIISGVAGFTI